MGSPAVRDRGLRGLHDTLKKLIEPVSPSLEIEPAEQGLQAGGGLVLGAAGRLGHGVGGGVPTAAVHIGLLLRQDGEQPLNGRGLGRGGHIFDCGPVEITGTGLAPQAEPGADHDLKYAVPQVGQPQ